MDWIHRLSQGLAKTREALTQPLTQLLNRGPGPAALEELEGTLLAADVGARAVAQLLERLRAETRAFGHYDRSRFLSILKGTLLDMLRARQREPIEESIRKGPKPYVILAVGVNGVGKTTTLAKLAQRLKQVGLIPVLVAADTFRAAAIEQLAVWAARIGVDLTRYQQGADPSAVVFDGIAAAKARGADAVLIDTAGRLHTKTNLMEELKKIKRVLARELPGSPHEVLLVLDATVGQNALAQARQFHEAVGVTGIALTKLDGTARGGIVVAMTEELSIPIRLIGVGEQADDLQDFHADAFVDALFEETGS